MGSLFRLVSPPVHTFNTSTMDYLTILTTRSLVLFNTPFSASNCVPSDSPTPALASISPPPVSIPLLSLMKDDVHCAHFLSNHVLEASGAVRDTHGAALDAKHRAVLQEAEVLAWQQICRAKTFAQELGRHYGSVDSVREEELVALAASHGIGLAPVSRRNHATECANTMCESVPRQLPVRADA